MLQEEVKFLLEELRCQGAVISDSDYTKYFDEAAGIIGFYVKEKDNSVVPLYVDNAGDKPPDLNEDAPLLNLRHTFLNLGGPLPGVMEKAARPAHPNRYRIGLKVDNSFPPTVEGTLAGTVLNKCNLHTYAMSANHVIWMNGWARTGERIVLDPFDAPPQTVIGRVPPPAEWPDRHLVGGLYANTTQEVAFARLTRDVFFSCKKQNKPEPVRQPIEVKPRREVFRADIGSTATVVSTNFCFGLRMEFGRFLFTNQLLLRSTGSFAERGDSGTLLFQQNDNGVACPVAMLWAGMPDEPEHPNLYVATPLYKLFQEEHLEFMGYLTPEQFQRNVARQQDAPHKPGMPMSQQQKYDLDDDCPDQ